MAYLKDLPDAKLHLIDAGHFAVEEKPVELARYIHSFLQKTVKQKHAAAEAQQDVASDVPTAASHR